MPSDNSAILIMTIFLMNLPSHGENKMNHHRRKEIKLASRHFSSQSSVTEDNRVIFVKFLEENYNPSILFYNL